MEEWLCKKTDESRSSQGSRVGAVKSLAIYMNTLGIKCHIPLHSIGKDHNVVHVLNGKEIQELFEKIDIYIPVSINPADFRMANEYPVMFRLYYCCGMRNNEVCSLETSDVDLKAGILTIRNGKNQKDRLVYMSADLCQLMNTYFKYITRILGYVPFWFFPEDSRKNMSVKVM